MAQPGSWALRSPPPSTILESTAAGTGLTRHRFSNTRGICRWRHHSRVCGLPDGICIWNSHQAHVSPSSPSLRAVARPPWPPTSPVKRAGGCRAPSAERAGGPISGLAPPAHLTCARLAPSTRMRHGTRNTGRFSKEMLFFGKFICRFMSEGVFFLNLSQRLDFRCPPTCSACLKSYLFVWLGQSKVKTHKFSLLRVLLSALSDMCHAGCDWAKNRSL